VGSDITLGRRTLGNTLHKRTSQNTHYIHQGTPIAAKIGFNHPRMHRINGNAGSLQPSRQGTCIQQIGQLGLSVKSGGAVPVRGIEIVKIDAAGHRHNMGCTGQYDNAARLRRLHLRQQVVYKNGMAEMIGRKLHFHPVCRSQFCRRHNTGIGDYYIHRHAQRLDSLPTGFNRGEVAELTGQRQGFSLHIATGLLRFFQGASQADNAGTTPGQHTHGFIAQAGVNTCDNRGFSNQVTTAQYIFRCRTSRKSHNIPLPISNGHSLEYMYDSDAERDYQRQVEKDLPRNFLIHLIHGLLGQTGFRLVNTPTFVPAYILLLSGGSDFAVGLALSLQALGSALTPLLSASWIGHRDQVLPIGFWAGGSMRVAVLGMALAGLYLSGDTALYAAIACMAAFGLFAGIQTVIFQVLLAKVIPVTNRGKLLGLRNFLAGITTIIVAWYGGNYLVGTPPTAAGYGWIFLLAFGLTSVGLLMLALVREPRPPTVADRQSLAEHLRGMPAFLRAEPEFARYVAARALATMGRMALPFYILYAGQTIGLSGPTLATVTIAFTAAATASNLLWGIMADRYGFRLCLLITIAVWIVATLALLLSSSYWAVIGVFLAIGASQEGFRMASMSLAMEFGSREQMALRVAIANTAAEIAGSVAPLLGGIVATLLGYGAVFIGASAVLALSGLVLLLWVPEPRYALIRTTAQ